MKLADKLLWITRFVEKTLVIFYLLLNVINTVAELVIPLIFGEIVEKLVNKSGTEIWDLVIKMVFLIIFCTVLSMCLNKVKIKMQEYPVKNMEIAALRHLFELGVPFFESNSNGKVFSIFNTTLPAIRDLFEKHLSELIRNIVSAIITFLFLLILSRWVGFYILFCFLPYILLLNFFNKKISTLTAENINRHQEFDDKMYRGIAAVKEIRAYQCEAWQLENISNSYQDYKESRLKTLFYRYLRGMFFRFNTAFGITVYFILAAYLVNTSQIGISAFVSCSFYCTKLIFVINGIIYNLTEITPTLKHVEVLYDFLNQVPVVKKIENGLEIEKGSDTVEVKCLSFSYSDERVLLKNVNFKIGPHEKILLTGLSGSGKTTLLKLLAGFYRPCQGGIYIGSHNMEDLNTSSIRSHIGYVFQETYLLGGTIMENIRVGRPSASEQEVFHAAEIALVDEFVRRMPDQYETIVGERGSLLSGGQKQRIAFARVILQNPELVILDEATASLDEETEKRIMEPLMKEIFKDKIVIASVHRSASFHYFNRRLTVDDAGGIQELPIQE